jgi:serine/threonine protein kinase
VLEWEDRYKIAVGICKALVYLHDGSPRPVIHMNVKPSNFFLSHDFQPQVKNGTLNQLNLHQLCVIVLKNCSSSGV